MSLLWNILLVTEGRELWKIIYIGCQESLKAVLEATYSKSFPFVFIFLLFYYVHGMLYCGTLGILLGIIKEGARILNCITCHWNLFAGDRDIICLVLYPSEFYNSRCSLAIDCASNGHIKACSSFFKVDFFSLELYWVHRKTEQEIQKVSICHLTAPRASPAISIPYHLLTIDEPTVIHHYPP